MIGAPKVTTTLFLYAHTICLFLYWDFVSTIGNPCGFMASLVSAKARPVRCHSPPRPRPLPRLPRPRSSPLHSPLPRPRWNPAIKITLDRPTHPECEDPLTAPGATTFSSEASPETTAIT